MVKVKAAQSDENIAAACSFNHPMVKVKDAVFLIRYNLKKSFNHPMVKVKAIHNRGVDRKTFKFQPPYGES